MIIHFIYIIFIPLVLNCELYRNHIYFYVLKIFLKNFDFFIFLLQINIFLCFQINIKNNF